jgi:hypothetical protein
MACERYEILLVDAQGQAKQKRDWNENQLLDSVPWLKRMNARGYDVLVRPSGQPRPMLLDRLTHSDVTKLERSGIPCLAKIEVEADRFQVWLHLGKAAVANTMREGMAKRLGLPKSDANKFGALAGFVKHQSTLTGERNRFVLAHEPVRTGAETAGKWERMLVDAEKLVKAQERGNTQRRDRGFSR